MGRAGRREGGASTDLGAEEGLGKGDTQDEENSGRPGRGGGRWGMVGHRDIPRRRGARQGESMRAGNWRQRQGHDDRDRGMTTETGAWRQRRRHGDRDGRMATEGGTWAFSLSWGARERATAARCLTLLRQPSTEPKKEKKRSLREQTRRSCTPNRDASPPASDETLRIESKTHGARCPTHTTPAPARPADASPPFPAPAP